MHSKFLEYLVEELGPEFNASDKPDKRASLTMTYHAGDARIAITLEMKTDTIATENLLGIFTRPRRPQKQSETDAAQALDAPAPAPAVSKPPAEAAPPAEGA